MKNIPLYEVRSIQDLRDMLVQSVALYGDRPLFWIKDPNVLARDFDSEDAGIKGNQEKDRPYQAVTFRQFDSDVTSFGTACKRLPAAPKRIAILGETRYEWYVTYLATVNGGNLVVPLDKELPAHEIASLLNRSHADMLVYSRLRQREVDAIRSQIPEVRTFVCMDKPSADSSDLFFWQLLLEGERAVTEGDTLFSASTIDADAMSILLFTSGTTAQSKAVMLSHRNICKNLMGMCQMVYIDENDVFLSVLPLHHTYECTCGFLCQVYRGSQIAICEGLRHIVKNMQECKATIVLVVPLMLEMFYKRIIKSATADPKLARKFRLGLKLSKIMLSLGIDRRRKLFHKVHDNFGGSLRLLIAGGAAIDPAVLSGMRDLGIHSIQGYGLTECAPILALNRDVDYNDRAAGLALPDVDIKIIDADENGIGEICGRGDNVMLGYFEDPEETAQAIDKDGFFHTGDLGFIDPDGFVIITGRKKNVIVTKNGKNVFPEELEFLLQKDELIKECVVFGQTDESGETVISVEVFPNEEKVEELFGKGTPLTGEVVKARIMETVRQVNHDTVSYKYIRNVQLRDSEFEKTTTRKIKRQY